MFKLTPVPIFSGYANNPEYIRILNDYLLFTKKYQVEPLIQDQFIGGMPVTLENNCFKPLLKRNKKGEFVYNMTLKVDGERYFMYLTRWGELYLIDRLLNFYYFDNHGERLQHMDPSIVKQFIFDGELVTHKSGYMEFLIFDVLFYKGESIIEQNYYTRYQVCNDALTHLLKDYFNRTDLLISLKSWFPITDIIEVDDVYQYVIDQTNGDRNAKIKLKADGLILQPFDTKYAVNGPWNKYNNVQFKWKPSEDQTMDFKIKIETNTKWVLLTRSDYPFTMPVTGIPAVCVPTAKNVAEFKDGDVAEFIYNKKKGLFEIVRARPNKMANGKDTILSVFNFIQNPFTLDNLKEPLISLTVDPNIKNILKSYNKSDLILFILKNGVFFNKKELNGIKDVYMEYKKSPKEKELEFRIIKTGKKDSNVPRPVFDYFLEFLKLNYQFTYSETIDAAIQKLEYSEPTLRSTYRNIQDLKDGRSILNEKKRPLKLVFSEVPKKNQVLYNGLQFKLNLSTEEKSNEVIKLVYYREGVPSNNSLRIKKRTSFEIGGLWRIDMTVVKSGYSIKELLNKNDTFEIECEFVGDISKITFANFVKSFSNLYILILQNTGYC